MIRRLLIANRGEIARRIIRTARGMGIHTIAVHSALDRSAPHVHDADQAVAVESYLDFHGNRFTRRFDANSYITLVDAMSSHDVGRDRGGVEDALARVTATTLVLGIDSDRLFPIDGQHRIARGIRTTLDGDRAVVLASDFGHDGFLIETPAVGSHVRRLLESPAR